MSNINEIAAIGQLREESLIYQCQMLIANRVPEPLLIKKLIDEGKILDEEEGLALIETALKKWFNESNPIANYRRKIAIVRLQLLATSLKAKYKGTPTGVKTLVEIEKELNKLEGNYAPEDHNINVVNTSMDTPIVFNLSGKNQPLELGLIDETL